MVVVGGENVHLAAVEDVLASHPQVAEVAVAAVPDPRYGVRLVAHVVRRDPALSAAQLSAFAAERLSRPEVPRSVSFRSELPRNATGKLVRRLLP
jgi:acyl-CoA synthetase (AMP-forming)/AMP-acid ligase II